MHFFFNSNVSPLLSFLPYDLPPDPPANLLPPLLPAPQPLFHEAKLELSSPSVKLKTSKKAAILNAWSDDRAVKQDSFSIPELNYQLSWAPKKTSK